MTSSSVQIKSFPFLLTNAILGTSAKCSIRLRLAVGPIPEPLARQCLGIDVTLSNQRPYLIALVVGSVLTALYDGMFFWHDAEPTSPVLMAWPVAFPILLALWVQEDSKAHPAIYRPFDFGYLVLMFWIPYLPYYLVRTRGLSAIAFMLAFTALYFLGYIAQWTIHAVR